MRLIPRLLACFALWGCNQAREQTPTPKLPESPPAAEPAPSTEARRPLVSPQPLREYRKYVGSIDGEHPITMDLTFKDQGKGLHGHGRYQYDQDGISKSVHADFHPADSFKLEMWDVSGNHVLETVTGRFTSLDSFAGDWTRYQPDSVQDTEHGTWKQTPIRREQGSFRMARTSAGITPVRFQLHRRKNDSASKARIRENRIEYRYDSLPSRLDLTLLQVLSGRDSLDSAINLSIERSMKEFCQPMLGSSLSAETPMPSFVDSLFAREWAQSQGGYFSSEYETEVMANANGVLSLKYAWSAYAGGAHGSHDHVYASIEVATGRKLDLTDILVPDYQDRLGALAGEPTCDGDPEREYPCTIEGLVGKGFAVLRNGLIFHATIGMRERDVFVDYADLAPLIRQGGILEPFRGRRN